MNLVPTWIMSPGYSWSDLFMIIDDHDWKCLWVPLPSCIYSSADHQWPPCWFCQWTRVLFYLLLHLVLLLTPPPLKWAPLSFQDTCASCFCSLRVSMSSASFTGSFFPLVLECWCPSRADLHSRVFSLHILGAVLRVPHFCLHPICLSSTFSSSF